ncbi:ABC transporter substrate-binding protein [Microcella alkalica]|uniref:Branched-chain amino acid transport system substrate-binding protein n=1 Tax=Microcella alkalica TaxID=355930 RepID=A0A839EI91_9MICO|nr:ABC transporter substrate-binding protein [Microcella alkalica]MBA8849005.1 branched-chain amino acid transport system substrate-binding protein [Microcella alkalica]
MRPAAATALALVLATVALAGCTATEPVATPTPVVTTATPTPIPPSGDGILRIGTLVPLTGPSSSRGPVQVAAVEIAVRDIAAAGGVLGAPVEVIHRDVGDPATPKAEESFADLVSRGVDVVIGPSDPGLVLRIAPLAAESGVTMLVPGASTAAVGAADPADVLFRVTPPLTAQVAAVGRALVADGVESIALLTAEGEEGLALADALRTALEGADVDVVVPEPLTAATRASTLARELLEPEAGDGEEAAPRPIDSVIAATSADLAPITGAALEALVDAGLEAGGLWLLGDSLVDYAAVVNEGALEGAQGVRAGADVSDRFRTILRQSDPGIPSFGFAAEVYDAVILAALAAELAGDDGGPSIAASLRAAAADGVPCTSFGACLDVLAQDREPDYDGLSGLLTIDESGDVVDARLALFRYSAAGTPERDGVLGD